MHRRSRGGEQSRGEGGFIADLPGTRQTLGAANPLGRIVVLDKVADPIVITAFEEAWPRPMNPSFVQNFGLK